MDIRIQFVLDFMEQNLEKDLMLFEIACLINLSESRLRHLFTLQTGMSPRECLHNLRLARAKQLLEEGSLSIDQIVMRVGWQDRSHFERSFKQLYGVTPAQYRASSRSFSRLTRKSTVAVSAIG